MRVARANRCPSSFLISLAKKLLVAATKVFVYELAPTQCLPSDHLLMELCIEEPASATADARPCTLATAFTVNRRAKRAVGSWQKFVALKYQTPHFTPSTTVANIKSSCICTYAYVCCSSVLFKSSKSTPTLIIIRLF